MRPDGAWWGAPGCYPVVDGVHRIPLSMPNDGLRAVNVYALETADGLVLIDGGWAVRSAMDELATALQSVGRAPREITDVFVTHIHRDHYTFAVRLRAQFGARVHLGGLERQGLEEIQRLQSNVPVSSLRELRRSDASTLAAEIETTTGREPLDVRDWADPDEWIGAGPLLVDGWELEAVHTPGHTKGHLVFHDVGRRLLFTGDHVLPTITPSIGFELGEWDMPLKRYLASLALLLQREDAMLLPAHGSPTASVHERVRVLLEHHRARFDSVLAAIGSAGGRAVAREVAEQLRWTRREVPFSALDAFNQMIAICETLAHLDVLVDRGALRSQRLGEVEHFAA